MIFKGNNDRYIVSGKTSVDYATKFTFSNECQVNIEGNIMSMIGGDNFRGLTSVDSYAFCFLFGSNTNIYDASNLVLPATTLGEACYRSMFDKCWNLVSPPSVLPATTAAQDCYRSMFNLCTGMTSTPEIQATTLASYCCFNMFGKCYSLTIPTSILPANTLANNCYENMFYQCTGLTTAPELPATILATRCYNGMFAGCTNLNYIKCLATTNVSSSNLSGWVIEVAATGTFVKAAGAS